MSSQYKDNIFSTENFSTSGTTTKNNINKKTRANIDHLIKRIHVERRRERKNTLALGFIFLLIIFVFYFFQN
tara:strand:- start:252 stop:467 length:216 start_codon:yes stop_codon:yes gene_type:complete